LLTQERNLAGRVGASADARTQEACAPIAMLKYEQQMFKPGTSEALAICSLLARHLKKSALVKPYDFLAPKYRVGLSRKRVGEAGELQELIAALEAYFDGGDEVALSRDTLDRAKQFIAARPPARRPGFLSMDEAFRFRIDAWTQEGAFQTYLGGSDDESIARAMFAEAVKQLRPGEITLSHGAAVLERAS
jgi:hypothetical protein